jgi:hypothetical protein
LDEVFFFDAAFFLAVLLLVFFLAVLAIRYLRPSRALGGEAGPTVVHGPGPSYNCA